MFRILCILIMLMAAPMDITHPQPNKIVFWNVGQGSWTTVITDQMCLHVDAGGKPRRLHSRCHSLPNYIWLTHYDWDHINQAHKILVAATKTCLIQPPPQDLKLFKKKFLTNIPLCTQREIFKLKNKTSLIEPLHQTDFAKKNDSSIFLLARRVLITGDASQKMEKSWLHKIPAHKIQILLAGHHGSRTSLSPILLKKLSNLQMTIVSAEKRKYGHPHKETIQKLKNSRIPMLRTEDFGSIAVEF